MNRFQHQVSPQVITHANGSRFAGSIRGAAIALGLLLAASSADAATHQVVGGELVGASDVVVGGALYDVVFLDGPCFAIFDLCDSPSDFTFQTQADAIAATQALLDQVLIDGPAGAFDSSPELVAGCERTDTCLIDTGYDVLMPLFVRTVFLFNYEAGPNLDTISPFGAVSRARDLSTDEYRVFAKWTPVPEPGTAVLLGTGLLLLGAPTRRRN